MKIAIAGGHSRKAPGASGYLDEYECDRAYVAKLIPALRAAGHTVVNCSNEKPDQNSELAEEVRLANASDADLFVAVHFNAGGGTGTEAFTYSGASEAGLAAGVAHRLSGNVSAALGIRNRGRKTANFYVLRKTSMPAVLLEVCFVDSETDHKAWKATSWDALTEAFVKAIGGESSKPAVKPSPSPSPSKPAASSSKPSGSRFGGKYRCTVDELNVRDKPSLKGNVVASYGKGQTVVLDDKYTIADGYVWGRYTGRSGKRRYIAVGRHTGKPEASDYLVKV